MRIGLRKPANEVQRYIQKMTGLKAEEKPHLRNHSTRLEGEVDVSETTAAKENSIL